MRLTASVRCQSSSVVSSSGLNTAMPALLTKRVEPAEPLRGRGEGARHAARDRRRRNAGRASRRACPAPHRSCSACRCRCRAAPRASRRREIASRPPARCRARRRSQARPFALYPPSKSPHRQAGLRRVNRITIRPHDCKLARLSPRNDRPSARHRAEHFGGVAARRGRPLDPPAAHSRISGRGLPGRAFGPEAGAFRTVHPRHRRTRPDPAAVYDRPGDRPEEDRAGRPGHRGRRRPSRSRSARYSASGFFLLSACRSAAADGMRFISASARR